MADPNKLKELAFEILIKIKIKLLSNVFIIFELLCFLFSKGYLTALRHSISGIIKAVNRQHIHSISK